MKTGQPLDGLLRCPPALVRALRVAWNLHAHEQNERQRLANAR